MNSRIAELANESGFDVSKDGKFGNYSEMHRLKKFAELIVRECGAVAYKAYWANPETVRGRHIEEQIRAHFGVEQ